MERVKSRLATVTKKSIDVFGRRQTRQTDIILSEDQHKEGRSDRLAAVITTTTIDQIDLGYPEDTNLTLTTRRLGSLLRVGYRVGVYSATAVGGALQWEIGASQSNALLVATGLITLGVGGIHVFKSCFDGIKREEGDSDIGHGLSQSVVKKTEIIPGKIDTPQNISEPAIE